MVILLIETQINDTTLNHIIVAHDIHDYHFTEFLKMLIKKMNKYEFNVELLDNLTIRIYIGYFDNNNKKVVMVYELFSNNKSDPYPTSSTFGIKISDSYDVDSENGINIAYLSLFSVVREEESDSSMYTNIAKTLYEIFSNIYSEIMNLNIRNDNKYISKIDELLSNQLKISKLDKSSTRLK